MNQRLPFADYYFNYEKLTRTLEAIGRKMPSRARLSSLGQSPEGREIWLMTITDFNDHDASDRPAVWVDGNVHAAELVSCQACLHLIEVLTTPNASPQTDYLLKKMTFYIVPRIAADGAEHVLNKQVHLRSTTVAFPGADPEENFIIKDIDGNGEVLQIRFRDPAGAYKVSKLDSRLMLPREAIDDRPEDGPYYHLVDEGEFKNFDGSNRRFVDPYRHDFNRQAPAGFTPKQAGAGEAPLQLSETRAVANAFLARPNIAIAVTHHSYGRVLLRPSWTRPDADLPPFDVEVLKLMGSLGEKITGYKVESVYHGYRFDPKVPTTGSWNEWHYEHRGVFSWTAEIWNLAAEAGVSFDDLIRFYQDPGEDALIKALHWCDRHLERDEFYQDWTPFNHPQLGPVEIGGWRMQRTWQNPPPAFLEKELSRLSEWTLKLAAMAPRLEISKIAVSAIEPGLFKVAITVTNTGFLPTHISDQAASLGIYQPPVARLQVPSAATLIHGKRETPARHLTGRSARFPWISSVYGGGIDNTHSEEFSYLLRGSGTLTFSAAYQGGGTVETKIDLN